MNEIKRTNSEYDSWHDEQSRFHRIGAPAYIYHSGSYKGSEEWKIHGQTHRIGGPALILIRNLILIRKEWKRKGDFHRLNAPAYIYYQDNTKSYWEFGEKIK